MPRRVCRQPAVVALMFLFATLSIYQMRLANGRIPISKGLDITRLPKEYATWTMETEYCENRFGSDYLHAFQANTRSHCDVKSPSQLNCFSNNVDSNNARTDTFCIGGPSLYIPQATEFSLTCHPPGTSQDRPADPFNPYAVFSEYWYETGPRQVFNRFIGVLDEGPGMVTTIDPTAPTAVLVKREDVSHNMWHSLMEIMSAYFSLDVLRMSINPDTGTHYFTTSDFDNTQVVILDAHSEGPYFDLWHLFARKPIVHLSNLTTSTVFKNIIVPLPGGSNPFWQGDWTLLPDCKNSTLLRAFSSRVLYAYNIATSSTRLSSSSPPTDSDVDIDIDEFQTPDTNTLARRLLTSKKKPINLTFLNRTSTRQLLNQDPLLTALRTLYPPEILQIHSVDYATIPFEAQLTQTHDNTDILVGVHGAGLTHTMFLRSGSVVVEFQPQTMENPHVGFRNLAGMMEGVGYVRGVCSEWRNVESEEDTLAEEEAAQDDRVDDPPTSTSRTTSQTTKTSAGDSDDDDVVSDRDEDIQSFSDDDKVKRTTLAATRTKSNMGDWHYDDVYIDEEVFLKVIGGVIDEMGRKRGLF